MYFIWHGRATVKIIQLKRKIEVHRGDVWSVGNLFVSVAL